MKNEVKKETRTSFYLTRKAEALLGVLRFFLDKSLPANRQLQFLAQSDFWEWEIDNLIYSFTNLRERSRTWQSADHAVRKLAALGVVVDAKVARKVRWRMYHGRWQHKDATRRVAPVEMLREVIDLWNELVTAAESRFVAPMRDRAEQWNLQSVRSLGHLRKSMPAELTEASVNGVQS
jgi:hypothetical protein